jgi:TolB-like protein
MRYLFTSLLLIVLLCSISYSQTKSSIAVLELEAGGISAYEAQVLSNRLRTELFKTEKFTVLERDKMDEILIEQGFQLSACTTNECAVEVGKLIGVQQIVAGNIAKIDNLFTIDIRLIDVETGKVLKTATEDCECELKDVLTNSIKNVARSMAGLKVEEQVSNVKTYQSTIHNDNLNNSPAAELNIGDIYISRIAISVSTLARIGTWYSINYTHQFSNNFLLDIGAGYGPKRTNTHSVPEGINIPHYHTINYPDPNFFAFGSQIYFLLLDPGWFNYGLFTGINYISVGLNYSKEGIPVSIDAFNFLSIPVGLSIHINNRRSVSYQFDLGYSNSLSEFEKKYPGADEGFLNVGSLKINPSNFYFSIKLKKSI